MRDIDVRATDPSLPSAVLMSGIERVGWCAANRSGSARPPIFRRPSAATASDGYSGKWLNNEIL